MTEKDKMIEEMVSDMFDYARTLVSIRTATEDSDFINYYKETLKGYARYLIKQNYRKLPKGSVVLSKEKYETLHKDVNNYKQRYQSSEKRNKQLVQSSCEAITKSRKETAKKILQEVKECKGIKRLVELGYIISYINLCQEIDEIANQFGVEVEE